MGHEVTGIVGLIAIDFSSAPLEVVVLGVAAGLGVVLLAVKAWVTHDRRVRRAGTAGYHQPDVAHYSSHGVGRSVEAGVDPKSRPLAPSFTAPGRGTRHSGEHRGRGRPDDSHRTKPSASTSPLGTFDPAPNLVRAFDSEEAKRQRPPTAPDTSGPSAAAAAESAQDMVEVEPEVEEIPPPAGALPLLQQPPPAPHEGAEERHSPTG